MPIEFSSVDEALRTTRSVRLRLDLERPVDNQIILDCIDVAEQAPSGGNQGSRHWIIVRNARLKAQLQRCTWPTLPKCRRSSFRPSLVCTTAGASGPLRLRHSVGMELLCGVTRPRARYRVDDGDSVAYGRTARDPRHPRGDDRDCRVPRGMDERNRIQRGSALQGTRDRVFRPPIPRASGVRMGHVGSRQFGRSVAIRVGTHCRCHTASILAHPRTWTIGYHRRDCAHAREGTGDTSSTSQRTLREHAPCSRGHQDRRGRCNVNLDPDLTAVGTAPQSQSEGRTP